MTYISQKNKVSVSNSSSVPLSASATFIGISEEAINYESVVVACKTDQVGNLYIDFSPDGSNWDSSLSFSVAASTNEVHRVTVTRRYFRVRFINTSVNTQSYFRLQTTLGNFKTLTSSLNSNLQNDADGLVTRSVITGETDGGIYKNVPISNEGHLEVEVHGPRLPFNSIHTENLMPIFQSDAVYGINTGQVLTTSTLSGSVSGENSLFSVQSGTTIYASASLQSRKRLRYRAGQGLVGRFAGYFNGGVNNSYALAGFGHAEDGVYFGYKNTEFGILHVERGKREVQTFTITAASTTNESITITLGGVANTVTVTNSGNINRTSWEISQGTYAGWDAYASDGKVIFVAKNAGNVTGAFSISATTANGTFSETVAGTAATETFVPQSSWNGDKLDGSGDSGYNADWTKGNVFQIGIQYLGFGAITFAVEIVNAGTNNARWVTVHTLKFPNNRITTSFGNPSYPFTAVVYSAGSTTNIGVFIGSFAGFIEGVKRLHGNRFTYGNNISTASNTNIQAIFSIMNKRVFSNRTNQSVVNILGGGIAYKHTQPGTFYIIKNGSLGGNVNFADYSTFSCSQFDTSATTVSITDNSQIIYSLPFGETGQAIFDLNSVIDEITLQPGEWITIGCRTLSGTATFASATLNTREDQ